MEIKREWKRRRIGANNEFHKFYIYFKNVSTWKKQRMQSVRSNASVQQQCIVGDNVESVKFKCFPVILNGSNASNCKKNLRQGSQAFLF